MMIPTPSASPAISSLHSLSSHYVFLPARFLPPGGVRPPLRRGDLAIRNGGGPRTYPGGVSKWQWKRMQAKKARQLLKARLARERQLYEMRKRTELRDAVAHLERPWDPDTPSAADASAFAPNLLSVGAEDQLRALADRFHRPGGVDLWNDRDGPRVFASPATGAASARFFPKNAVHSVQPYALASGEASAPRALGNAAVLPLLGRGDGGAQGARENATENGDEAYLTGDDEPAVELMERDGTWEPVNALGDGDDSIPGNWSSDDDSDVDPLELEDMGDVLPRHVPQPTMLRRNGRYNGVARWEAVGAMAPGSDDDRDWSGGASFSDSEQAREGHREQRWQGRSAGARKHGVRWNASSTAASSRHRGHAGAGSFSDSEVIHGGSEPKWRPRTTDDIRNSAGRWNASGQQSVGKEFNSNSGSARDGKMEPSFGARNKFNGRESFRRRSKPEYRTGTSGRDAPGRHVKANNGDEHLGSNNGDRSYRFDGGFGGDLEVPTWKPRRMNRARDSNGAGRDDMGGRFRRGGNARRLQENPRNINKEDGRMMNRNRGQRLRGDYSLRPTSELQNSWREGGLG
ncbi:hypothetical protein HU200_062554 [Digitaria exilis]|uniref:Uncharacterized protein n=1 Tax=Digitaria exilis TaxID=1010633 RepID=A0A835A5W8_9POAL|nr:hypothetical protein HU200_062554 [Digitaria exilis]